MPRLEASERGRRVRRVLAAAIVLNAIVAAMKIGYGRLFDSLAIEADGYHSLTDGISSLVALGGMILALRPPDARHPYGRRKLETLVAAAIGVSLLVLAVQIGSDAIGHLSAGSTHTPRIGPGAFIVLLGTLAVNLGVASYQARAGRALASELLSSDAQHTRADCFVTLGVLASTALSYLGIDGVDLPAAIAVALLVAKSGADIVLRNARVLTDAAPIDAERVRRIALSVPLVAGAHTVRARGTEDEIYVDLRVSLPPELSVAEASRVSRSVTRAIQDELGSAVDVTIHTEPAGEPLALERHRA